MARMRNDDNSDACEEAPRLKPTVSIDSASAAVHSILPDRRDYSIIFPYGWEKQQLTREMLRMFPRKTGRRVLIMLDELHQFFDSREKP